MSKNAAVGQRAYMTAFVSLSLGATSSIGMDDTDWQMFNAKVLFGTIKEPSPLLTQCRLFWSQLKACKLHKSAPLPHKIQKENSTKNDSTIKTKMPTIVIVDADFFLHLERTDMIIIVTNVLLRWYSVMFVLEGGCSGAKLRRGLELWSCAVLASSFNWFDR